MSDASDKSEVVESFIADAAERLEELLDEMVALNDKYEGRVSRDFSLVITKMEEVQDRLARAWQSRP